MNGEKDTKSKKSDKLGSLDKVYSEMKSKNKKLKKEIGDMKGQLSDMRTVFAEFQV